MTMAIGPLISVAIPIAIAAVTSESRRSIQTPMVMNRVKATSIRAVCAETQTSIDVAQTNAAIAPPIRPITQIRAANARSDGITNAHVESVPNGKVSSLMNQKW